jgi:glycosyltransferase involved in cell wall biosynthesis
MKVPHIAYCSPVNPAASGISDYSEELLPYLGQYAAVSLYLAEGLAPANPQLARHLEIRPLRRLPRDQRKRPFDAILYHMGNSPVHAEIWQMAQQVPGVMVLHEFVLHHFMLWYAANVQHDVQQYVRMMEQRYGANGRHCAELMIRSRFSDLAFDFPCSEAVVAAAQGIIAHNRYVYERVRALRPELPAAIVPMGVPLPVRPDRDAARARLGLPLDAPILAGFGHINAYKRLEPALQALATLRRQYPAARYILVGSVSPNYDPTGLAERLGLADALRITGYVPRRQFEDYVAAADICLNLRAPTAGETSASLLRLLGAGRPTLVSALGSFAELPPGVAAQVDLGHGEVELIAAYCRLLLEQPVLARAMGAQARNYVAQFHNLELAAAGYARFLARLYRWPLVRRRQSEPLWDPAIGEHSTAAPGANRPAAVPAAPVPREVAAVAARLAELGINQRDEQLLRFVAERMAELGIMHQQGDL